MKLRWFKRSYLAPQQFDALVPTYVTEDKADDWKKFKGKSLKFKRKSLKFKRKSLKSKRQSLKVKV